MISAKVAGFVAILTSVGTLIATIYYVPAIIIKIVQINEQVKSDAEEFRAITGDAWQQLILSNEGQRHRRQVKSSRPDMYRPNNNSVKAGFSPYAAICGCEEEKSCPPRPRGPPGKQGDDGVSGDAGRPGAAGLPGNAAPVPTEAIVGCRVCPNGPRGPTGLPGQIGLPGDHGATGKAGNVGDIGRPGYQGSPGAQGVHGEPGKAGEAGAPGRPGIHGSQGLRGTKGKTGLPGVDGEAGYPGHIGSPGAAGLPGFSGPQGHRGLQGTAGPPGHDVGYCPCPARMRAADRNEATDSTYQEMPTTEKSSPQAPAYKPLEAAAAYA